MPPMHVHITARQLKNTRIEAGGETSVVMSTIKIKHYTTYFLNS